MSLLYVIIVVIMKHCRHTHVKKQEKMKPMVGQCLQLNWGFHHRFCFLDSNLGHLLVETCRSLPNLLLWGCCIILASQSHLCHSRLLQILTTSLVSLSSWATNRSWARSTKPPKRLNSWRLVAQSAMQSAKPRHRIQQIEVCASHMNEAAHPRCKRQKPHDFMIFFFECESVRF